MLGGMGVYIDSHFQIQEVIADSTKMKGDTVHMVTGFEYTADTKSLSVKSLLDVHSGRTLNS